MYSVCLQVCVCTLPTCIPLHTLVALSLQLASLLQGDHSNEVASYTIIDCRYPYEFDGGHITGALNIWDKDSLLERFFDSAPVRPCEEEGKRSVLIYHCEFSSKRGPDM